MPVIRKECHRKAIHELGVEDAEFGRIMPFISDDAACRIEEPAKHHFRRGVAVYQVAAVDGNVEHIGDVGNDYGDDRHDF